MHAEAPSPAASANSPRPNVTSQGLDGTALFGAASPFVNPDTHEPTPLSQVEVEAEADRMLTCNLLASVSSTDASGALQKPPPIGTVQEHGHRFEETSEALKMCTSALGLESAKYPKHNVELCKTAKSPSNAGELLQGMADRGSTWQGDATVMQQTSDPAGDAGPLKSAAEVKPHAPETSMLPQAQEGLQMTQKRIKSTLQASTDPGLLPDQPSAGGTHISTPCALSQNSEPVGPTDLHTPNRPARPAAHKTGKKKSGSKSVSKDAVLKPFEKVFARYAAAPAVHSGIYLCDFGQIVKGLSASKKIVVQSTSSQAASISVDKALLEAYGCSLLPEKLPKLEGAPHFGSAELTLTMHTNLAHVFPEAKEFHLLLNIRNAPPVLIMVRALVVVPEVVCSSNALDFGTVQWGMSKIHTIHLENVQSVPAEWSVKQASDDSSECSLEVYRCEPSSGTIAPHSHMPIKIYFTPEHPCKHAEDYPQEISIRVVHNNRRVIIAVMGSSYLARARVVPKTIDLGVVLPTAMSSSAPIGSDFVIRNPGPSTVEVFSLDFDTQYLEEEAMLSAWQGYSANLGYALLPPRAPGEPFWQEIVRDVQAAQETAHQAEAARMLSADLLTPEQANADLATATNAPESALLQNGVSGDASPIAVSQRESSVLVIEASPQASAQVQAAEVGELELAPENTAQAPFYAFLVTFEDDFAAEQATRLAERYGVPCTTLTDLVLDAGELEEEFEGMPYEGGTTFGDFLYEELIGWESVGSDQGNQSASTMPPRPYLAKPAAEVEELIARAVAAAVRQAKFAQGFVIQGLSCEFASAGPVLHMLLQNLGLNEVPLADEAETNCKVWNWEKELWFVTLDTTIKEADARRKARLSPEQMQAEAEAAEAASTTGAAASTESIKGKKPALKKGGKDAAPEPPPAFVTPPGVDPKLGLQWAAYQTALQAAQVVTLLEHPQNAVKWRKVQLGLPQVTQDELHRQVIGLQFMQGAVKCVLPRVHADTKCIPPPYLMQVVCKPPPRKPRRTAEGLSLMAVLPPLPPAPKPITPPEAKKGKASKGPMASVDSKPEQQPTEQLVPQARWVLGPGESAPARLQFCSTEVTELDSPLVFEVYCGEAKIPLAVKASCAYPQISSDPRNVYKRRTKGKGGREGEIAVRKQYVTTRKRFEFGPLLIGRQAAADADRATHEHATTLRLTNNGRFDLKARLMLKSVREAELKAAAAELESKGKNNQKGKGKVQVPDVSQPNGPFSIQPEFLDLKIDETAEVTIWCFPSELGDVSDVVVCIIENNPEPIEFPMTAIGTMPAVDIRLEDDQEADTAETAQAPESSPASEPKLAEPAGASQLADKIRDEGVVFERLLPGRTATKGIVITNKSDLPVWWELTGLEDLPHEFTMQLPDEKGKLKTIKSASGILTAGGSTTLLIDFCSIPLDRESGADGSRDVEHTVTLEIQDSGKVLGVVQSEVIVLRGETYLVEAELEFASDTLQEIDFGMLKVCDLLHHQCLVHSSKCKYDQGLQ
jgi:hypothetical protein